MKGAAIIVKLRGQKGLETEEGADMFAMVRNQVLSIHCMPCSPQVSEFTWLLQQDCRDSFIKPIAMLDLATSRIRQDADRIFAAANREPRTIEQVLNLLRRAQELEIRFRALNDRNPPPKWVVDDIDYAGECPDDLLDSAEMFPGKVYGFPNLAYAVVHLATWTCHLMLTTSILRCMAWLVTPEDYRTGREYQELADVAVLRIQDIVSTAPYFCKWNGYGTVYTDFPVGIVTRDGPPKGAAGLMVLWPLFAASGSDFATPLQKRYLKGRLRFLADFAGIKQANVFLGVGFMVICLPSATHGN
jgi:hypothetical protein